MKLNSQKGYSVLEVGIGLIIISIFMVCGVTMLKGTYENYLLVEQKNLAMTYLIKGIEKELLKEHIEIDVATKKIEPIVTQEEDKTISTWSLSENNMTLTTIVENLPNHNGISYKDSKVKLVTGKVEFYMKKNDPSSKRVLELKTFKIEGD